MAALQRPLCVTRGSTAQQKVIVQFAQKNMQMRCDAHRLFQGTQMRQDSRFSSRIGREPNELAVTQFFSKEILPACCDKRFEERERIVLGIVPSYA